MANRELSSRYYSSSDARAASATIVYCKHCGSTLTHYNLSMFYSDTCYSCDDLAASIASARQLADLEAASYSEYDPTGSTRYDDNGSYTARLQATGYDYIDSDGIGYRYSRLTSEGM